MMTEINRLPAEMLFEVHQRLPPSALKQAVLVNKLWRDVGKDPSLWEWCIVTVYSKEDIRNLSINRLQRIQEISINPDNWGAKDWEAFFRAVMGLSSLKKIGGIGRLDMDGLSLVEPGLFARSLAKLEVVVLSGCTYDYIQALFTEMASSTQVKKFHLSFTNLSQMDPGLFSGVLSRLEDLRLDSNKTTKAQMEALFIEIQNNNSLKRLVLDEDSWRHLQPGLFGKVLSKVEEVSIRGFGVYSDHMEALLTELSFGTQLKRLDLIAIDLSEPPLLAKALSGLEEVSLDCTRISTDQIQTLFTEMLHRTNMKKLSLHDVDLSQLDPGLFARVLVRLEDVYFDDHITIDAAHFDDHITIDAAQLVEFFTEMSRNSRLKSLTLSVDLSPVDPEILAAAVSRLETVTLDLNRITNDQAMALFSEMSSNTVMKKINLAYNDLSSVDQEDFARALNRLEEVRLDRTSITHDQAITFFREMSQNTQLKKLTLMDDFTTVDPEVLAAALTNVKEVNLRGSNLSTDQIISILTFVLEEEKNLRMLILQDDHLDYVNPEVVRKVKEKLKGKLVYNF